MNERVDLKEWAITYSPYLVSFGLHLLFLSALWVTRANPLASLRASLGDMNLELIGTSGGEGGRSATSAQAPRQGRDRTPLARKSPRSGKTAEFREKEDPQGENRAKDQLAQKPDPFANEHSSGRDSRQNKPREPVRLGGKQTSALAGAKGPIGGGSPYQGYIQNLYDYLETHKYYPMSARKLRLQGSVDVGFRVLRDGRVDGLRVIQPSNSQVLNRAALKTVQDINGKFPLPRNYPAEAMEFEITFEFAID